MGKVFSSQGPRQVNDPSSGSDFKVYQKCNSRGVRGFQRFKGTRLILPPSVPISAWVHESAVWFHSDCWEQKITSLIYHAPERQFALLFALLFHLTTISSYESDDFLRLRDQQTCSDHTDDNWKCQALNPDSLTSESQCLTSRLD